MQAKHSKLGASSCHRWWECPGSVDLCKDIPYSTSIHADRGTAAHSMIEDVIQGGMKSLLTGFDKYIGWTAPNKVVLKEEDVQAVSEFFDFFETLRREPGEPVALHSEVKFNLSRIDKTMFGTADVVLVDEGFQSLKVIDYKHGAGVPVEVENNKQLMYYALGAIQYVCEQKRIDYLTLMDWGGVFDEVEIIVVQPRCEHADGTVRRWVVPMQTLNEFARELKHRADATREKNAPLIPGPHCRFCAAAAKCPAVNDQAMAVAQVDFKAVSDPKNLKPLSPALMTDEQVVKALTFAPIMTAWLKSVHAYAVGKLKIGEKVEGFKMVRTKPHRKWIDEDEARAFIGGAAPAGVEIEKLLSPAKIEKLLSREKVEALSEYIYKPEGELTLAASSDKRPEVTCLPGDDFNAVTN